MTTDFTVDTFLPGDRVEIHPGTDRWMTGDRFGEVEKFGRKFYVVRFDKSRHTARVPSDLLGLVESGPDVLTDIVTGNY